MFHGFEFDYEILTQNPDRPFFGCDYYVILYIREKLLMQKIVNKTTLEPCKSS